MGYDTLQGADVKLAESSACEVIDLGVYIPAPIENKEAGIVSLDDLDAMLFSDTDSQDLLAQARKDVAEDYYQEQNTFSALRLKSGLSQRGLASKIGSTQSYISRLEKGTLNPGLDKLRLIAQVLNVTLDELDKTIP